MALKHGGAGPPIADVCRQMGISEATYYVWKKRYGNFGTRTPGLSEGLQVGARHSATALSLTCMMAVIAAASRSFV